MQHTCTQRTALCVRCCIVRRGWARWLVLFDRQVADLNAVCEKNTTCMAAGRQKHNLNSKCLQVNHRNHSNVWMRCGVHVQGWRVETESAQFRHSTWLLGHSEASCPYRHNISPNFTSNRKTDTIVHAVNIIVCTCSETHSLVDGRISRHFDEVPLFVHWPWNWNSLPRSFPYSWLHCTHDDYTEALPIDVTGAFRDDPSSTLLLFTIWREVHTVYHARAVTDSRLRIT